MTVLLSSSQVSSAKSLMREIGISFALRTRVDSGLLGIVLVMMMDLGLVLSELIHTNVISPSVGHSGSSL
jgi:hypothetical protein